MDQPPYVLRRRIRKAAPRRTAQTANAVGSGTTEATSIVAVTSYMSTLAVPVTITSSGGTPRIPPNNSYDSVHW